ncbi:MAG: polyprenyl synthetase family protein [Nitrososphaerales archaeon]|nr:polyprenyl synthetase family protein [Nitrososphaerales archaeon]
MASRRAVSLDSILDRMKSYADRVNRALSEELAIYAHSRFYDPLVYAVEGGKRVRPLMLMLSAEALGKRDDSVLDAAVAIELLHTESIIHDDIIDEAEARRSRMTFHVKYGFSASLLTADFVFALILAIAARYKDMRIAEEISKAALRMAEGEYSELTIDPKVYNLTWDEYLKLVADKTASLFEMSAKVGALIARGKEKEVAALANFGKCLGIAYQLRDDLLDWRNKDKIAQGLLKNYSESEVVGKMAALSQMYAEEAKRQLLLLPRSAATEFLEDITDFAVQREH